jgi:hypothetical protein
MLLCAIESQKSLASGLGYRVSGTGTGYRFPRPDASVSCANPPRSLNDKYILRRGSPQLIEVVAEFELSRRN